LGPDPGPQLGDIAPQGRAAEGAVPDAIPPGEQVLGTAQQLFADRATRVRPVHHRLEVANQMGPAYLTLPERQPEVGLVAVGRDDLPGGRVDQSLGDGPRAGAGDSEHRDRLGDDDPQPATLPFLPPARFVYVGRLATRVVAQRCHHGVSCCGRLSLGGADLAGADGDAEDIRAERLHHPLTHPVGTSHEGQDAL
jgi:hypothetical protein